jgi:hypothetical protein
MDEDEWVPNMLAAKDTLILSNDVLRCKDAVNFEKVKLYQGM